MNKELLKMVIPETTEEEVRAACRAKKAELGFDIEKAMFPHHPFNDAPLKNISLEDAIKLSREFGEVQAPVLYSVQDSVESSALYSVEAPVLYSVEASVMGWVWRWFGASVLASVWASSWAYVSSIFFNIKKWEGIEHEEGVNPFQSAIDLWEAGYVPVYHANKIQIYTKDGLVWEGE